MTSCPCSRNERARSVSAIVFDGFSAATRGFNVRSTADAPFAVPADAHAKGAMLRCRHLPAPVWRTDKNLCSLYQRVHA